MFFFGLPRGFGGAGAGAALPSAAAGAGFSSRSFLYAVITIMAARKPPISGELRRNALTAPKNELACSPMLFGSAASKAAASPSAAASATSATSSNGDVSTRYAWHPLHTRAIGGPDSPGNRGALSHADVMAGDPLAAVITNFEINAFTLEKTCPALLGVDRLIIFHGCAGAARDLRSRFPRAEIHDMTPKKLTWVNPRTGKEWQNTYGCHHAKAEFVFFKDGVLVSIHSSNLIKCDLHNKSQGIWMQKFPIKKTNLLYLLFLSFFGINIFKQ